MAARPRSNTAMSSQRPDSRASTTSATSDRYPHSNSNNTDVNKLAHPRPASQSAHASFAGTEAALAHFLSAPEQHPQQYQQHHQQYHTMHHPHAHHAAAFPMPVYPTDQQYGQPDPAYANHVRVGSVPAAADVHDDKRRKGSAVTATNDRELREMLSRNMGRPLKDVAQEVIQKERTPMAEKTKQLFAMLWLRAVCKPAKTSVPRNRVYSQYASRCGTERVVPLNPASFGKLVRVIFPGIQTRRLGVRGESKYHYVDLALEEEQANSAPPVAWPGVAYDSGADHRRRSQSTSTQQIDFNNIPRLQADTAAFPDSQPTFDTPHIPADAPRGPPSRGQAFAYPDTRGMDPGSAEALRYPHTLRFPSSNLPDFSENEPVSLPSIYPYLPPRTDPDTAEALFALYRTHCTSLIDSIRFCKEKQFFRLYTSFHGTLTVPVQKLFTHPNLAPWIEQCDLVMYRTMIRFVSHLTLQAAPVVVINIMSNISISLHGHIERTFAAQPQHVIDAKVRPATVFGRLLHRLIRVNQSAHAAANLLTIDQNREQMWREWVTMVNPKRVMETELPDCGYDEAHKILTTEMRGLLEPLPPSYGEDPYAFGSSGAGSFNFDDGGSFASFLQSSLQTGTARSGPSAVSSETVLDRWSAFISSLPARFPAAPARTLVHCVSAVGTAALRDITILNGASYGHWWVLKIFVDEMTLWLAEMGGFLEPAAPGEVAAGGPAQQQQQQQIFAGGLPNGDGRAASRVASRSPEGYVDGASGVGGFGHAPTHQQQQHHHHHGHPMGFPPPKQQQQQQEADLDDSGIALLEDDLKAFGATHHHHHPFPGMQAGGVAC